MEIGNKEWKLEQGTGQRIRWYC